MFLHSLKKDKLEDLSNHLKKNGVTPRVHGNKSRQPRHALKFDEIQRVISFIINYAEQHAIILPGRHPRHWITDAKLLPTSCTKHHVFQLYKEAAATNGYRDIGESTFLNLWNQLVPFVRTMPPASDLCWKCQETTRKMQRAANRPDAQKIECVRELEEHLRVVKLERKFYKDAIEKVKETPGIETRKPGTHEKNTFPVNHVSFDFAQQTHYPYSPQQPGPIFFKTPRKCGLFGINAEALGKQVNFLIDEAHACGKGANSVISYLHFYLENYSIGEIFLMLHADNASGQNKNNYVMWYLHWRILTERNKDISISFLIAGHTKFAPDGGFGLLKRKLKNQEVNSLRDIEAATNASSDMNVAEVVGWENDAESRIPTYDWVGFLTPFYKKIPGLKKYHHFIFDDSPKVTVKLDSSDPGCKVAMYDVRPVFPAELPNIIPAPGLPNKRQWNLYKDIREFVCDDMKDTVCPKPSEPLEKEPAPKPSTSKAKPVAAPKRKKVAAPKRKTTASTSSGSNKKKA